MSQKIKLNLGGDVMDWYTWIFIGFGCFIIGVIWCMVAGALYRKKNNIKTPFKLPEEIGNKIGKIFAIFIIAGIACFIIGFIIAASTDTGNYGNDPLNGHSQEESSSSSKCRVCGRDFYDSTNKRSIYLRNMCTQCYKNLEYGNSMLGD